MHSELSVFRPLVEFAVIAVIIGLAGCIASRDQHGWWLSQGLIVLGLIFGLAAAGEIHSSSNVMSLAAWLPPAILIEGLALWCGSRRKAATHQGPPPANEPENEIQNVA